MRPYYLIGAGGTGSILFDPLTRYLRTYYSGQENAYRLFVIDGKEVGESKLERQLFGIEHIGMNKAEAIVEKYALDPNVITSIPAYLDKKNVKNLSDDAVILIAADNFPVRARIERQALKMENVTVINGGNEMTDGSLQIFIRRNGENVTPPMSQGHPEILRNDRRDPAMLSCEAVAALPGGEQTITANMQSATLMLTALSRLHDWEADPENLPLPKDEVFFDLTAFAMRGTTRPEAL